MALPLFMQILVYTKLATTRYFTGVLAVLMLSACASTTEHSIAPTQSSLALCRGLHVSNAPPTNTTGTLKNFNETITFRGKALSVIPVMGCLSSGFGRRKGGAGNHHNGIDLFTKTPLEISAAGKGKVTYLGWQTGYGRLVEIDHGKGITTRYAHLSKFSKSLKLNSSVQRGDYLGKTGKSGNATAIHLHYELRVDNKPVNPLKF